MKYIYIVIGLVLIGCCEQTLCSNNSSNMPSSVLEWQNKVSTSFDRAEKEIFKKPDPAPKPDDGTNPDPAKCICRGTGIIVQGDGHKTQCPYHSKQKVSVPIIKQ